MKEKDAWKEKKLLIEPKVFGVPKFEFRMHNFLRTNIQRDKIRKQDRF